MREEVEIEVMDDKGHNQLRAPAQVWIEALYRVLTKDQQYDVRVFLHDRADR